MCPSEWIATKTLWWLLGGHIVFMITYILCLFYFCPIWAVWVLWITYDKSLKFILCSFLRAWWRLFRSLVSPMCTTKPSWWYLSWYLWGHTVFMIIFCVFLFNIHSNTSSFWLFNFCVCVTPHLKMKPSQSEKQTPSLKGEAPFHEMIPRKNNK